VTATRAAISYHFTPANGSRTMPGKIGDWKLVYRTPGRIVEVAAIRPGDVPHRHPPVVAKQGLLP